MSLKTNIAGVVGSYKPVAAGLMAAVFLLEIGLASAATTSNTPGASGLSISPLRQELTLKPGQADKIDITLKNITGGPIIARSSVLDFQSDNLTGNPKVIASSSVNDPTSIKNFLVGLGNVPLATGQQTTFSIPVQTPANAVPGAYYGLIEYQAVPQAGSSVNGNNKVALSAGVSTLVFITVPGNLTERMSIKAIHVYKDTKGTSEGLFFTSPPKAAGVEVDNLGNAFEKPFGRVTLEDTGGKSIYSYEMNGSITRGIVLPSSRRIFINPLSNIKKPGRYTLVANLSYGSGSAILIGKKTFWYIPAWVIIIIVFVLILLIALAYLARRRYKRATSSRYHS